MPIITPIPTTSSDGVSGGRRDDHPTAGPSGTKPTAAGLDVLGGDRLDKTGSSIRDPADAPAKAVGSAPADPTRTPPPPPLSLFGKQWRARVDPTLDVRELTRYLHSGPLAPRPGTARVPVQVYELVARLLASRGLASPAAVGPFLDVNGAEKLASFTEMPNIGAATTQIAAALEAGQKIVIFGDYDADGITATAILMRTLRQILSGRGLSAAEIRERVVCHLPHRITEGYGMSKAGVDEVVRDGCQLLITVDNGVRCRKEIEYALAKGMQAVVTDHHALPDPPTSFPDIPGVPVVHPALLGAADHPSRHLSGAGVAFKLAQALRDRFGLTTGGDELTDLCTLGTIADLVPLTGDNRLLVKKGLALFAAPDGNPGASLLAAIKGQGKVTAGQVGFYLAPLVNAAGRMADPEEALSLFLEEDPQAMRERITALAALNEQRKKAEAEMTEAVRTRMAAEHVDGRDHAVIIGGDGWHKGVIGIVASRVVEETGLPAVIMTFDREHQVAVGSLRTVPGISVLEALNACADLFTKFGGHEAAGGFTLPLTNLAAFKQRYNEAIGQQMIEQRYTPAEKYDLELDGREISVEAIELIERLAPFGSANPSPKFVLKNATVDSFAAMGQKGDHLRLSLAAGNRPLRAVAWRMGQDEKVLALLAAAQRAGQGVDVLCTLEINAWNGRDYPQLVVKDLRSAATSTNDR